MNKKINIMHVTNSLDIGGLEMLVLNMLNALDRQRFSSRVCTLREDGKLIPEFTKAGIPVHIIKKRNGLDFFLPWKLKRLFQENQIDIVHTHNYAPWLYAAVAKNMVQEIRLIHTEHSNVDDLKRRKILEKILSYATDYIVCDSANVAGFMVKEENINRQKIKTILNGIDVGRFSRQDMQKTLKKELGIDEDTRVIGTVGRLVEVKDHLTLIKSFSLVLDKLKNVILIIVGDGPLRKKLEDFSRDIEVRKNIMFLGARDDVDKVLQIFDLFVLSSLSEGLPLALIEAMAASIPVVATAVGGNCEVVPDEKTGYLVTPKEPKQMAEKIITILTDKKLQKKMGECACQRVREHFNLEIMVQEYEQLYLS
ncbi:MAG: glycosyltransferase [Candidatus Omnitrophota bacterium]